MRAYPATFGHGPYTFGDHLNADGTPNRPNAQNTTTIDRRESAPQFREGRDAYHLATGGQLGRAHKGFNLIRLNGRILVPDASQQATLADKEASFRAAFDPELCYRDSPSTDGAYAFDFSEPTADTANYPTGRRAMRYYARPMAHPTLVEELGQSSLRYALGLICPDPRCYEQAEQTLTLTPASASGSVVNRGNVPAPLKAVINMSGAGSTSFTITRAGVSFVLNLSTIGAAAVVVVVFETCGPYGTGRSIVRDGSVSRFQYKTSGPDTWLDVPVGSTVFSMSNTVGITSCVLHWYSARA